MPVPATHSHARIPAQLRGTAAAEPRLRRRWISGRIVLGLLRSTALALACAGCAGCQRGCLTTWLVDHGVGRTDARRADPLLGGVDCSDGLARCVDGRVERSELAVLPARCGGPEGAPSCSCPWTVAAECRAGCADEGLEVTLAADGGTSQLCRTLAPVARPVLAEDGVVAGVCADAALRCVDGFVTSCAGAGLPVRVVARCLHGCDERVAIDVTGEPSGGAASRLDGRVMILCRHADEERR